MKRIAIFLAIIQSVLVLTHLFLYKTWAFAATDTATEPWIPAVVGLLSLSFVSASLLAFRYTNALVRAFYRAAAFGWACSASSSLRPSWPG